MMRLVFVFKFYYNLTIAWIVYVELVSCKVLVFMKYSLEFFFRTWIERRLRNISKDSETEEETVMERRNDFKWISIWTFFFVKLYLHCAKNVMVCEFVHLIANKHMHTQIVIANNMKLSTLTMYSDWNVIFNY